MHPKKLFILLLLCLPLITLSEDSKVWTSPNKKGSFYFYWGYNRTVFSKSTIHFNGPNYDITFYDLTASDRPSPVNSTYISPRDISIPQFNYRLGYYVTDHFAISIGMDHMKYVVDQNQSAKMSGVITEKASSKYVGNYLNTPVVLTKDLLMFEHTNGFNLFSLDFEYLLHIYTIPSLKLTANWNFGAGGIWLVTKTDVKVMGDGLDNEFHLSGYTVTGKTGPRIEYGKHIFLSGEARAGYATLPSVLIKNSAPERADHSLRFIEYFVVVGVNFRLSESPKTK